MNAQKIAIIGSGISGLTCASLLHRNHQITIFEANNYIGGHTNTVEVNHAGQTHQVDTGFIVSNERNYDNFFKVDVKIGRLTPTDRDELQRPK